MARINYVSKWVKAIATQKNDAKIIVQFVHKNIFTRFGTPHCIISDEGSRFCNIIFALPLGKYNVWHAKSLPYYSQSNEQVEISTEKSKAFWKRR